MEKSLEQEVANAVSELLARFPSEENSVCFKIASAHEEGLAAMTITGDPKEYVLKLSVMQIDSEGHSHIRFSCPVRGNVRKIRCWLRREKTVEEIAEKLIKFLEGQ